jgi:hypothetical protein
MVMAMKVALFWDAASCILVEIDQHFKGAYYFHHEDMESQCNIPEDSHFQKHILCYKVTHGH